MDPTPVLHHYPALVDLPVSPITAGLINDTFALGDTHILQRLHPIFAPEVNLDIEALTAVLSGQGVPVPRLVRTAQDKLWVTLETPAPAVGTWRAMTRLPGQTHHRATGPEQIRAAAQMLGRFHGALLGTLHRFNFARPGAHDTDKHMATLAKAVAAHPGHRLHAQIADMSKELQARWDAWGTIPSLPMRIGHGDGKLSNFLFDDTQRTVTGVIDLDTMAWMGLDIDLGDALRSWCNPWDENHPTPYFDKALFAAAVEGHLDASSSWITAQERRAIAPAVERICLELSARFAADALNDAYFGWDPQIAPSRPDHNLLRARGQLALARSVAEQRADLMDIACG